MSILSIFRPRPTLSEEEIQSGLRWMTWEGTVSMGFFSITTSGILVAFALALGANNFHIGVLAAIPFAMQIMQLPAIWLVEKLRWRKAIAIASWLPAQFFWLVIACIPFFMPIPGNAAVALLLGLMAIRGILSAITNSAWNGWTRDLVPQSILGRFFSRRLAFATASAIIFSLAAAFFIDMYLARVPGEQGVFGYTYAILFGAVFLGLASPVLMTMIPEPLMQHVSGAQPSMAQRLMAPLKDTNFRRVILFLFYWSFASNLAIPFFAVHMLQQLGLPVFWVIGLSVLSQLFNILFLRVWGPFADRFSNKSVLSVGVSLYLLVILGWIFTAMPGRYVMTVPLLIILHIFAGIAGAAVSFTVGTIGFKLSPRDESTSYLATAALATNLGAGFGPLLGGVLANFFSTRQLNLIFNWIDPSTNLQFTAMNISGRDFLFGIAFILGLLTLGLLARIKEEGESGREVILESLLSPMREFSRPVGSAPGPSALNSFPFGLLRKVPVPGLDIALGVTVFQIAEMARATVSAAVTGRRVTNKMAAELEKSIMKISRSQKKKVRLHGEEVVQHATRGALHVMDEKPVKVESLVEQVMQGVISASEQVGIDSYDTIVGASKGIVQGALETGTDVTEAVEYALKAVSKSADDIGMTQDEAVSAAAEGALQVAEAVSPEVVAEVVEAVPEENLPSEEERG